MKEKLFRDVGIITENATKQLLVIPKLPVSGASRSAGSGWMQEWGRVGVEGLKREG